jgi:hypothetical protein
MLQVVTKGTLNNHSMRSDIQGLKHFRHDSNRYFVETIRSRRICIRVEVANGMRMEALLSMKLQFSSSSCCSMIPGRIAYSATPAVGAANIPAERQRIKRSRDIYVTRPIEARSSKSVS